MSINVTKTFLPPFDEYVAMLKKAWDTGFVTNGGILLQELESELKKKLGTPNLLVCSNGTIVLQMALKALGITGEVITTPFSYVATTTAILWEQCTPVFVDINEQNFCIDASKIEEAITEKTQAILATHVYGHPCDIDAIADIAGRHDLKVIYDAAHAFGSMYKGRSVMGFGDVSTCSFHATKLFHMVEGGCVISPDKDVFERLGLYRAFGHVGEDYYDIGINAKNSELHAAMGLCNLNYLDQILARQKHNWEVYATALKGTKYQMLEISADISYNYAYFPLVLHSAESLKRVLKALNEQDVWPRRYFNPALNRLPYIAYQPCSVAESIAERVICLPVYYELSETDQMRIVEILLKYQTD